MKNGFTLIELLAVIVILAVIALIATPIVLGIINDSKESAILRSAEFYVDSVKNGIMKKNLELNGTLNPEECEIIDKYKVKCDEVEIEVEVDGEVPDSGFITFDRGKTTSVELVFGERKVVTNSNGELVLEDIDKLAPGLYDENDNLIYTWDELLNTTITYYVSDEEVTSPILNVDANGVLTGTFDIDTLENHSAEYLVGKLVIDESVTSIGESVFWGCENLTSVIIPNSVTSIGAEAFAGCSSLTSITISNSVTSIGDYAFNSCTGLTSITIPDSVTSIGNSAFSGCTGLESVTIGNGVTSISGNLFSDCSNLTSIMIPNNVTSIGWEAFTRCTRLTSVIIPNSVTYIEGMAFSGCSSLASITIPTGVTNIEVETFALCTSLSTINYKGTEAEWNVISKSDDWDAGTPENKVINYNYEG